MKQIESDFKEIVKKHLAHNRNDKAFVNNLTNLLQARDYMRKCLDASIMQVFEEGLCSR